MGTEHFRSCLQFGSPANARGFARSGPAFGQKRGSEDRTTDVCPLMWDVESLHRARRRASIRNYSYGWDSGKNKTFETITGTIARSAWLVRGEPVGDGGCLTGVPRAFLLGKTNRTSAFVCGSDRLPQDHSGIAPAHRWRMFPAFCADFAATTTPNAGGEFAAMRTRLGTVLLTSRDAMSSSDSDSDIF